MEVSFCIDCLNDALQKFLTPQIHNSDQSSQLTSNEYLDVQKRNDITISLDGRGRVLENVFVERV
jgi:putative transposase